MRIWVTYILISFLSFVAAAQTNISSYYFENDESIPTPYSQSQLEILKDSFLKEEISILKIYSYTDSIGTADYNLVLAQKRLDYVTDFLGVTNSKTVQLIPQGFYRIPDVKDYKSWRRVDVYYAARTNNQDVESKTADSLKLFNIKEVSKERSLIEEQTPTELSKPSVPKDSMDRYTSENISYILNIEFFEGTAKMDLKSEAEIKKFALFLKEYPNPSILIRGHVCCGNNMRISKARARAVYHELMKQGIDRKRMKYSGMSNTEPLVSPEKSNADRQRNRRVDVKFKVIEL